jgi:hypothetical protein
MAKRTIAIGAAAVLLALLAAGCPRGDAAEERDICAELADRLCAKWFECWPLIATDWWGDEATCVDGVQPTCANADELYECDMDNGDLADCNDNVDTSECGSLPQSCIDLVDCSA